MVAHSPNCNCFDCLPDHPDALLNNFDVLRWVNDKLGFGLKEGDTVENIVPVYQYNKNSTKRVLIPAHSSGVITMITPKFIFFKDGNFIDNDPDKIIGIPPVVKTTVETGRAVEEKIKEGVHAVTDWTTNVFTWVKYIGIGLLVLAVIVALAYAFNTAKSATK